MLAGADSYSYFINEEDEIRNIEDPKYYFKFLLSKNDRVNDRQRFHFNGTQHPMRLYCHPYANLQKQRPFAMLSTAALRTKA